MIYKTFDEIEIGDVVLTGYGIKTRHEVIDVERQPRNMMLLTLSRLGFGKDVWTMRARRIATLAIEVK